MDQDIQHIKERVPTNSAEANNTKALATDPQLRNEYEPIDLAEHTIPTEMVCLTQFIPDKSLEATLTRVEHLCNTFVKEAFEQEFPMELSKLVQGVERLRSFREAMHKAQEIFKSLPAPQTHDETKSHYRRLEEIARFQDIIDEGRLRLAERALSTLSEASSDYELHVEETRLKVSYPASRMAKISAYQEHIANWQALLDKLRSEFDPRWTSYSSQPERQKIYFTTLTKIDEHRSKKTTEFDKWEKIKDHFERQRYEIEARVHGVIGHMLNYLGISIQTSDYPRVFPLDGDRPSHYLETENIIGILHIHKNDGYVIGEEVAHWIHAHCSRRRDVATSLDFKNAASNGDEFLGYIGRRIAQKACAGTEYGELFPHDSPYAPQGIDFHRQDLLEYARNSRWYTSTSLRNKLADMLEDCVMLDMINVPTTPQSLLNFVGAKVLAFLRFVQESYSAEGLKNWKGNPFAERERSLAESTCAEVFDRFKDLINYTSVAQFHEKAASIEKGTAVEQMHSFWKVSMFQTKCRLKDYNDELRQNDEDWKRHIEGYVAAAVWLEQNPDKLMEAVEMFYMGGKGLYQRYVGPLKRYVDGPWYRRAYQNLRKLPFWPAG